MSEKTAVTAEVAPDATVRPEYVIEIQHQIDQVRFAQDARTTVPSNAGFDQNARINAGRPVIGSTYY